MAHLTGLGRATNLTDVQAETPQPRGRHQKIGLALGPALALVMMLLPNPDDLGESGWRVAAVAACMALWWATEAIPVAATALVPLAIFPVLGIADIKAASAAYAHPTIYLFLGGFLVALAVQRWGLHRRIALAIIVRFGGSGASLVGGFMLASALLSMWVTNTSTTMMLLPIATSVVLLVRQNLEDSRETRHHFPLAMMLGVAYGATIGGMATLVGTPPNALLAAFMEESFGVQIGFGEWMLVGLPLSIVMLPLAWWLLARRLHPLRFPTSGSTREHLRRQRNELGPWSRPEKRVGVVFVILGVAWVSRPLLTRIQVLEGLSDTGLAMLAALALFLIPSGSPDSPFLMRWRDASELPWGLLLLFGAGLSLASAVSNTGLAEWLGEVLVGLGLTQLVFLVIALVALVIFLTELTSNLATTATFLPVVAAVAAKAGFAPIALTAPVALAASCAFMLPVATPPNAVVYGSGLLGIPDMVRAGFWLNILGVVLVSLVALTLAPALLG